MPRLPCPSLSPGVCSNSCALSRWCHPTISSSVTPFCSCHQSFPASGSFPMSWLFAWGGQSIGVSASKSVLPMNIQDWLPLGLTGLISLLSKELSSLLQHHSSKASIHWRSASFMVQLLHLYVTTGNLRGSASPDLFQMWPRLPGSHGSPHLGRSVLRVYCFRDFSRGHISIDNVAFMQHIGPSNVIGENLLFSKFNSF